MESINNIAVSLPKVYYKFLKNLQKLQLKLQQILLNNEKTCITSQIFLSSKNSQYIKLPFQPSSTFPKIPSLCIRLLKKSTQITQLISHPLNLTSTFTQSY